MRELGIWLIVLPCIIISAGCLLLYWLICWYDTCERTLKRNDYLKRDGSQTIEPTGFRWRLFLRLHRYFAK